MKPLSPTLLAAQQSPSRLPFVRLTATNCVNGVVRLDWERLYSGPEAPYHHALTIPGDGSLVRVRTTPPSDGRKLYLQRVASPGPTSDFSDWDYSGHYNCLCVAAVSSGAEVSVFLINTARELRCIRSTDYGASWQSPELLDYSPTTAANGLAAAGKENGDLAVFFADQSTLYVKKRVAGAWQSKSAWDKSTGALSGVAAVYSADWDLIVTGKDPAGRFKLWSLAYGDGGEVAVGEWSALRELASAEAEAGFEFNHLFLDRVPASAPGGEGVCRCFFVEAFSGVEEYACPFWSHSLPGVAFPAGLWREPVPFPDLSEYGLAVAHDATYGWLSSPSGVWRAPLAPQTLDLTPEVLALRSETSGRAGSLTVELRNDHGLFTSLPAPLSIGCTLEVSPGYVTPAGSEVSPGLAFVLEGCEYLSAPGKSSLVMEARDGWSLLEAWTARHQVRWNPPGAETAFSVQDILAFVLARVGLDMDVTSGSTVVSGACPDFTVHPGDRGHAIVSRLLELVPDLLFIEGAVAHLVCPQADDVPVYAYGALHAVFYGRYRTGVAGLGRVQVEGRDPAGGSPIIVDVFDWPGISRGDDCVLRIEDRDLETVTAAEERGGAVLRKSQIAAGGGEIIVPVNCGQQLYDVIEVTDARIGLAVRKRVISITLVYQPDRGKYEQRLGLAAP